MNIEKIATKDKITKKQLIKYLQAQLDLCFMFRVNHYGNDPSSALNYILKTDSYVVNHLDALDLLID